MDETAFCRCCHRKKPQPQFYSLTHGPGYDGVPLGICKACMHGPSPSGLAPVSVPASFAAGLADVIDQIGRIKCSRS